MDLKNYIEKQEKAQIQLPLPGSGAQAVSEDLPTAPAASSGSGVSQLPEVGAAHVALNQPPHEVIEILDSPVDDDAPAASVAAVGGEQAETAISRTAPGQPPPSESYVIDLTLSAGNDGPSANPDAMQVDEEPTPPEDSTPNAILDNLHSMDAEVLPVLSEMPSQPEEVPQDPPELALDNETDSDSVAEANMEVDSGGLTSIPEPLPPDAIPLEEEEEMAIPQEISITGQTFVEKLPQSTAREASPMTNGDEAHGPIISEPTKEEEEEEEEEEVVEEDEKQEAVVAILLPIPDESTFA
ncbi:hypothetical protein EST38_g951 [Candolleomyces aberdarensis]|uniref:Uncharacterized protein n=1 Tax=Candolleomyces aberdarensis TaxID=2316362 RepID=A0A4Q2DZU9_9AGAR|nr:hypothetical protein EST38_g951 [Candolleomyces aberdarensis]